MKRIHFLACTTALLLCAAVAQGQTRTVDTVTAEGRRQVIELQDTVIDGQPVTDTLSITTYDTAPASRVTRSDSEILVDLAENRSIQEGIVVALIAITVCFICPVAIISIVFYFRHKNRKARYRLIEQALANGQQVPPEFFQQTIAKDNRTKGFSNFFLGVGLFVFLTLLTGEVSIGCVGFLIACIGLGQLAIYYTREKEKKERKDGEI